MKKTVTCMPVKLGVLFFTVLFFQMGFVQASKAQETTPFYKSWLQEHSYAHPDISSSAASAPAKKSLGFSEVDTGSAVAEGEIAWGHHKTSANAVSIPTPAAFVLGGKGSDVPDSEIVWGPHKS